MARLYFDRRFRYRGSSINGREALFWNSGVGALLGAIIAIALAALAIIVMPFVWTFRAIWRSRLPALVKLALTACVVGVIVLLVVLLTPHYGAPAQGIATNPAHPSRAVTCGPLSQGPSCSSGGGASGAGP